MTTTTRTRNDYAGMTQREKLLKYLRGTDRQLTQAEAQARFGVKNLRARMSELRSEGFRVRTVPTATSTSAYKISRRTDAN